jgi:arylsulfatase A-like enzyme
MLIAAVVQAMVFSIMETKSSSAEGSFERPNILLLVADDWMDRCKGRYDRGYDAIRQERLERQKKPGIVDSDAVTFPKSPTVPAWSSLTAEQKQFAARKMELYAAMIEYMDWRLYNLREDPAEMRDLSTVHPEKREALLKLWEEYVKKNNVIVSEAGPFARREP